MPDPIRLLSSLATSIDTHLRTLSSPLLRSSAALFQTCTTASLAIPEVCATSASHRQCFSTSSKGGENGEDEEERWQRLIEDDYKNGGASMQAALSSPVEGDIGAIMETIQGAINLLIQTEHPQLGYCVFPEYIHDDLKRSVLITIAKEIESAGVIGSAAGHEDVGGFTMDTLVIRIHELLILEAVKLVRTDGEKLVLLFPSAPLPGDEVDVEGVSPRALVLKRVYIPLKNPNDVNCGHGISIIYGVPGKENRKVTITDEFDIQSITALTHEMNEVESSAEEHMRDESRRVVQELIAESQPSIRQIPSLRSPSFSSPFSSSPMPSSPSSSPSSTTSPLPSPPLSTTLSLRESIPARVKSPVELAEERECEEEEQRVDRAVDSIVAQTTGHDNEFLQGLLQSLDNKSPAGVEKKGDLTVEDILEMRAKRNAKIDEMMKGMDQHPNQLHQHLHDSPSGADDGKTVYSSPAPDLMAAREKLREARLAEIEKVELEMKEKSRRQAEKEGRPVDPSGGSITNLFDDVTLLRAAMKAYSEMGGENPMGLQGEKAIPANPLKGDAKKKF